MDDEKNLVRIVKKLVEPLSLVSFLRLKGYRHTDKHLCNSAAVYENREEQLMIVFYKA